MSASKWPRIKWNQANARLANAPFENLFSEQERTMSALDDVIHYHADNCQSGSECDLSALSRAELAQLREEIRVDTLTIDQQGATIHQLRADLQAAQERIARIDTDNRTLISEYKTLEDRYTEQARQLDAAREIIGMAKNDYQSDVQDGVDSYDKGQRCIDWLAANPAPETEPQP